MNIDPEFKRSATAYARKHGLVLGVFLNEREVMFCETVKPGKTYIWTTANLP